VSRRLGVAALLTAGVIGALGAGPATSAQRTVAISGRAYAFNHSDTGLAGAVIRVRELPRASAVANAVGDYVLRVPDDTTVTPYIEPPPGYHQIDLQTFHTRGEPIENANFQVPGDAEYNGLSALLSVPLGPDGRPQECVIVTTASARNVRGVDFATFQARTPHGVPGAAAHAKPALDGAIYFNDAVIPDRSRTATSGDGGIIWTGVPAGAYRVITTSPLSNFASFLATCEPGRIVNANPPWGAYELSPGEKPLGAGEVAGSVGKIKAVRRGGGRELRLAVDTAEPLKVEATLRQDGDRVGPRQKSRVQAGSQTVRVPVAKSARRGRSRLTLKLVDGAGDTVSQRRRLTLPPPG
jgi:hypothetical protein